MAFYFNNASSNGITLADNAVLTMLQSTGWTFSIWVQSEDRSGTANRRPFAWFAGGAANNYYIISIGDTSASAFNDDIRLELNDDDGTAMSANTSSNPFASNTSWTHLCFILSGTTASIYVNGSSVAYTSNASFDDINRSGSVKFGNNQYDNTNWKGSLCEWAYWNRTLPDAEIVALSKRLSPSHFRNSLQAYMPMVRDYAEVKTGIAVTNNGTTVVPHPPMIYPSYTIIGKSVASTQNLTPPLITSTEQLHAPAFVPGDVTIQPPAISSSVTMHNPTIALQDLAISAPLINSTVTFYNPTFVPGDVTIAPPVIASSVVLYDPAFVTPAQQNLNPPVISSTETFYNPTLAVGEVTLNTPLIDSTTLLYSPSVVPGAVTLTPPVIPSTVTFYAPTITPSYTLTAPIITSTVQFYDPTLVPGSVSLGVPLIASTTTMHSPSFVFGQSIQAPFLAAETVMHSPSISFSFVYVTPNDNIDFELVP